MIHIVHIKSSSLWAMEPDTGEWGGEWEGDVPEAREEEPEEPEEEPEEVEEKVDITRAREKSWAPLFKSTFLEAKDPQVKKLQDVLKQNNKRTMIQVRSLDQSQNDMRIKYGVKCGFFTLYNLIQIAELIRPDKPIFDAYDISQGGTKILGDKKNFAGWFTDKEKLLMDKIAKKDDKNLGSYTRISGRLEDELSVDQMRYLLSLNDVAGIFGKKNIIIPNVDTKDIGLEKKAEDFFDDAYYWDELDTPVVKIKRFRETGQPVFMVILKRGHWIPVVMTKFGFLTANSYEDASVIDDFNLQKLYDFFLIGDIGEEVIQDTSSEKLTQALGGLKKVLGNLSTVLAGVKNV